ncbi:MAG: alpha/beta hydrolase [Patescibacteria group bacterium]
MSEKTGERPAFERHVEANNLFKNPTLVVPGVGIEASANQDFAKELEAQGHNVYSFNHPSYAKTSEEFEVLYEAFETNKTFAREWYAIHRPEVPKERIEALLASIPLTLFEEAYSVIRALEDDIQPGKKQPITAIGHSLAGQTLTFAAFLRPDLFSQNTQEQSLLIFINPAGVVGGREDIAPSKSLMASGKIAEAKKLEAKEKLENFGMGMKMFLQLTISELASLAKSIFNKEERSRMNDVDRGTFQHLVQNLPQLRFLREVHDNASVDILPFLEVIHGNGVSVVFINDEQDSLFPAKAVQKRLQKYDFIEQHSITSGGHYAPVQKPKLITKTIAHITGKDTTEPVANT